MMLSHTGKPSCTNVGPTLAVPESSMLKNVVFSKISTPPVKAALQVKAQY